MIIDFFERFKNANGAIIIATCWHQFFYNQTLRQLKRTLRPLICATSNLGLIVSMPSIKLRNLLTSEHFCKSDLDLVTILLLNRSGCDRDHRKNLVTKLS